MRLLEKLGDIWDEHGTKILTAIEIGGAVLTPILAARATLKAKEAIDEAKNSKQIGETAEVVKEEFLRGNIVSPEETDNTIEHKELTTIEKIKIAAPYYIPTAICVGVTIGCAIGSEKIHLGRELELGTLVSFWEQRYLRLDAATRAKYGENEIKELKKDMSKTFAGAVNKPATSESPKEVQSIRNERFWVWDDIAQEHFKTCINDMSAAVCHLNQGIANAYGYGKVTWNDFRRFLGQRPCKDGDKWSWDMDNEELTEWMAYNGDMWIDLNLGGPEGVDGVGDEMAYALCFNYPPLEDKKG